MNNRHNPIAITIGNLQQDWLELTAAQPGYRLFRWSVKPEESVLVTGLLKLESTPDGGLPELFVTMFTPFRTKDTFARSLISEWTGMWENDASARASGIEWDIVSFRENAGNLKEDDSGIALLAEMLQNFREVCCHEGQPLVLAFVPRSIADFRAFNEWILQLLDKTLPDIKLAVIDHLGENHMLPMCKALKDRAVSREYSSLGLSEAIRKIATSGDPNDPEIQFRTCVFEMSNGVVSKNPQHIIKWGEKAAKVALGSGSKTFLGSAYLIYAGFLLQLKDDRADPITDKGISVIRPLYEQKNKDCVYILIQLYALKTAFCSINGRKSQATEWAAGQARIAVSNGMGELSIVLCRVAAQMAKKSWDDDLYYEMARTGYHAGDNLEDEALKNSEIGVLAFSYMKELTATGQPGKAEEIDKRMSRISGAGWKNNIPDISMRYSNTIPGAEKDVWNKYELN